VILVLPCGVADYEERREIERTRTPWTDAMNGRDYIGRRGETIFAFLIGKKCTGRFWFRCEFLGDKAETKDFTVYCIDPACTEATFFVQVKATSKGYTGKGKTRRLKVNVSERDVRRLNRVTGPAFIAPIDIESEDGYLISLTKRSPKKYSGVPCKDRIDCKLIEKLWKRVEEYWTQHSMVALKSLLS
jgi:hypothetical protein